MRQIVKAFVLKAHVYVEMSGIFPQKTMNHITTTTTTTIATTTTTTTSTTTTTHAAAAAAATTTTTNTATAVEAIAVAIGTLRIEHHEQFGYK